MALVPLDVPSYTWKRIKKISAITEWAGNIGNIFYISPKSSCIVLTCIAKEFLFFSGVQEEIQYLLLLNIKCINLISSEEDGMISHDL